MAYQQHFLDKFWSKVNKTDKCWNWTGRITREGYGALYVPRKYENSDNQFAHRISYEIAKGKIPGNLCVDHLCRNRMCVNPKHLEAVTTKENLLRGNTLNALNANKELCVNGHEFGEQSTYYKIRGWRRCNVCHRTRNRNKYRMAVAK